MKNPSLLLALFLIPFAACATTDGPGDGDAGGSSGGAAAVAPTSSGAAPADASAVRGHAIRAEWRNLNPRYGEQYVGLINRTSPEAARLGRDPAVKGVDDETMAALLAGYRDVDFFEHAQEGKDVRSYQLGDGHGVVSLTDGDKKWALLFKPGMGGTPVPGVYRDLKTAIVTLHNQTLGFSVSTPQDPDRVFRVPAPTRTPGSLRK